MIRPCLTSELALPDCVIDTLIDPAQDALFAVSPRTGVASEFYGHVPFAMWLVQALRPRTLVELGTDRGVSYAAFCEAVRTARLSTRCAAIDAGAGDPLAFTEFAAFHEPRYGSFSRLVRAGFDDAAAQFADDSLDLLYIDGRRTYDSVRHDFETWLPKLSSRAVVLLHATNERSPGFGVWRLWDDLRDRHPSFEFMHGCGLGVLAVGAELAGPARDLCHLHDPALIARLRDRFAQSGLRCTAAAADAAARAAAEQIGQLTAEARAGTNGADRVHLIARANEIRAAAIRRTLEETEHALAETRAALAAAQTGLVQNAHDLASRDHVIAHLREFERAYHSIIESNLWRALAPVKRVLARVPRPIVAVVRRTIRAGAGLLRSPPPSVVVAPPPPPPPPEIPAPIPLPNVDAGFSLADIEVPRTGYLPLIDWFDPIAPEVSIVIYNRNGGEGTLTGLQHLWQNTTGHRYEIIIVDNGSAAGEIARLQAEAPLVRVIPLGGGPYFGEANNIGVEAAQGTYVCLLDAASFVTPGWLEPLVQALAGDDEIGAAGPDLVQPDGILFDAGWLLDPDGSISVLTAAARRTPQIVDALSASCLLMRRADFVRVLGFDLTWDPGSFETADLCLKLRLLGRRPVCCPGSRVVRVWPRGEAVSGDVVALNRAKFVDRWSRSLNTMWQQTPHLVPEDTRNERVLGARPLVLIFTPYQLTPGGGERYILTIAQALAPVADVTLVTPYRVSRARLRTMARAFELKLGHVDLAEIASLDTRPTADLAFVLGNELLPTAAAMARHNIYICQFPFPFERDADRQARLVFWRDFELILTYSNYVRSHVLEQIDAAGLPSCPVEVLNPPAPAITRRMDKRRGQILNVGRFFAGGHCKRQDAMIDAFRSLREAGVTAELHFAGSTMPEPVNQAYYAGLVERAAGLPIVFHPNCSAEALQLLYAESDLYWHATGIGRDVERLPHVVEHFGISIVEAMSARCIPVVFAAGGPAEIVNDGITGFHCHNQDELVAVTRRLLDTMPGPEQDAVRDAAEAAAKSYDEDTFTRRVLDIAGRVAAIGSAAAPASAGHD